MKKISFISVALLFSNLTYGQSLNGIYGIYNYGSNPQIGKIDSASGNVSNIGPVPFYYGGLGFNSTFTNPYNNRFYFSNGKFIAGFDLNNSSLILNDTFPIGNGQVFINLVFNACDMCAYGIHSNGSSGRLAKYDLTTGAFIDISPYNMTVPSYGNGYSIDLINQLYVYLNGPLLGYDLITGQLVMSTAVQNIPGESFIHMVYDCMDSSFYGTSVTSSSKYFSRLDQVTGIVTHISNNNLNTYLWKNADALFTIDPFSGIYYYRSGDLISVDVQTGIGTGTTLTGLFANMTYFPQCECNLNTLISETSPLENELNISPNPTTGTIQLTFNKNHNAPLRCEIIDVMGETVFKSQIVNPKSQINLDVSFLAKGIYVVRVGDGERWENRKLVVE